MHSITHIRRTTLALAICSLVWPLARAAPADDTPQAPPGAAEVSMLQIAPAAAPGLGQPLSNSRLADYRGGFKVVTNAMQLNGTVANNTATDVMTGNNYIGAGAFSNASGLPMVIQNSGSNVLIQNATIVNVEVQ